MAGGGDPCTRLAPVGKVHGYPYPLGRSGNCAGAGMGGGPSTRGIPVAITRSHSGR
jgi:hypothetical protein